MNFNIPEDQERGKKPAGFIHEYTEEQVKEIARCSIDPIYFIEKYVYIEHPTQGAVKFKLYDFQKNLLKTYIENNRLIAMLSRQCGKALTLDTPIPTPTGWTTMGEIKIGDQVIGEDGMPTTVDFATEVMYDHDVYEVEFDNGEKIKSDAEHLWKIESNNHNRRKPSYLTTEEIIPIFEKAKSQGQSVRIRVSDPLKGEFQDLLIKPYTLGIWLGDGNSHDGRFTSHISDIEEIRENINLDGYTVSDPRPDKRRPESVNQNIYGIRPKLRDLGVLKNKHIPRKYLRASFEQRLELLKGLMDTDGHARPRGHCEFYQKDRFMTENVFELVASLGLKPRIREKKIGEEIYHTVVFSTANFPVFKLERKAVIQERCLDYPKNHHFYIKEIRKIESEPVRCIRVDNDDHMFLCGKSMIPTHNTTTAAAFLLWWACFKKNQKILIASKDQDGANEIMERLWYGYEELPWWIKPGVRSDQVKTKKFDNNSVIRALATTATTGRGKSNSIVYLDEFAYVRPGIADKFWTSLYPTLACVTGDTLVLTENGFQRIENFHKNREIGDYFELDFDLWGKNGMEKVSHGYVSPKSKTIMVETQHGLRLEVTPDHPLYVCSSNGGEMKKSSKLLCDDYVRVETNMNSFGKTKLEPELAYMLGGYTAEGWITQESTIWISNTSEEFRKIFLEAKTCKPFIEDKKSAHKIRCSSRNLVRKWVSLGVDINSKAWEKTIPECILTGDSETVRYYLRGLFDGDGCSSGRISLGSSSRKLIQEVQLLLFNLGLVSSVYKGAKQKERKIANNTNPTKEYRDFWFLNIPVSQSKKFMDLIGFGIEYKRRGGDFLCRKYRQEESKQFTIPSIKIRSTLAKILKETGENDHWFRKNGIRIEKALDKNPRKITVKWLEKLREILIEHHEEIYLRNKIFFDEFCRPCFWDRIVSLTPSTNRTYDFTVPGTHSFLQNGILGSNTGGKCIITSTPNTDEDKFATIWFNSELSPRSDEWHDPVYDQVRKLIGREESEEYETIYEDREITGEYEEVDLDDEDEEQVQNFVGFHAHWTKVPDRDGKMRGARFKKEQFKGGLTNEEWMREFECAFVTGEETLISPARLSILRKFLRKPRFVDQWNGRWYEEIKPNMGYAVVLDPSEGVDLDDACIQVWEIPTLKQVYEWNNNKADQTEQTKMLRRTLQRIHLLQQNNDEHYGDVNIYYSVERNGLGIGVLNLIEVAEEGTFIGWRIDATHTSFNVRGSKGGFDKPMQWSGLLTSVSTKKRFCIEFKSLVERNLFLPRSAELISQMKTFIKRGQSWKAKEGSKDDIVMSCVLMCHMIEELKYQEPDLEEYIRVQLEDNYDPEDANHPLNNAYAPIV